MPQTTPQLTEEGLEKLNKELTKLKLSDRPEIVKRMADARELGDLSENADYHDAREQLAFVEGRIQELESLIKRAEVVSSKAGTAGVIQMGSKVGVTMGGKQYNYTIVGATEGNPSEGQLSVESPVASALMGRKVGESVDIQTPGGKVSYSIKSVA